jgi:hypothetical protein
VFSSVVFVSWSIVLYVSLIGSVETSDTKKAREINLTVPGIGAC